ncbi:MAG: hypothetical protein A2589_00315 [Candidatus Vogelbacteria bacterium RIFOXYD1_FULL_46_19]|uniref:DNA-directed DNA polymerase n=1 Tax=Candidatus Vogelbacteria bacterium RIFOXYD1_FULL_46_19 TaxID=1802439 RepID=A0A1G2QJE7_9BACT|nr:MAG: hypothetical protein A2589_00315 [Candidatus Vogelbacteria bacterium RIFOXYD1_FULL_46_19]
MATKKYSQKLVLFDAHAILHRAYHALPDFVSAAGEPTGGLYGLASMLLKIIQELKPDYMAACYDLAEPTFRKKVYDNYKAGRAKADEALVAQMNRSRDIFTAFGIPIYDAVGFEADDIIGTIVEQTKAKKDLQVVIASGDMDTMQLVTGDQVLVYTLKRGLNDTILYDEESVRARFGFAPEYLTDFKGLRGDPSDNIIGISGIGEKTATTLIQEFGSIEKIYKTLGQKKGGEQKFLDAGIKPRIISLLKEGEEEALFSKTLATIRRDAPIEFTLAGDYWRDTLDFGGVEKTFQELDFKTLLARARAVLTDKKVVAPEDQVEVKVDPSLWRQAAVAWWILDSNQTNPDLADLLNYTGKKTLEEAWPALMAELKEKSLLAVYQEIEEPLLPILKQAEQRGILVDVKYLAGLSKDFHGQLKKLEQQIFTVAGQEFNLNSPRQLGEILFDKLMVSTKGLKKTAGGARSTRESELLKLQAAHPIVTDILKYRELQKLVSTYLDAIPKLVDEQNRLHSKLNQAGTTTGRMSSTDPNLQNIPSSDAYGAAIRRGFVATPGHVWVAGDYSQIELRVLALLSKDSQLLEIFKTGQDVHRSVASLVFGVAPEEVTKDMRRQAKVINFGIIYGMGVNALRANLGSTREEAQTFHDNYFQQFAGVREYFDTVIAAAYTSGYTETMFGRRRYFPGLKSKLPFVRAQAERAAFNAPIQGTEADIVKLATIRIDESLRQAGLINQAHFLLQVHDELIYEVEQPVVDRVRVIIEKEMKGVLTAEIPLDVNIETGPSWGQLQEG